MLVWFLTDCVSILSKSCCTFHKMYMIINNPGSTSLPSASMVLLALNSVSRSLPPVAIILEPLIAIVFYPRWFGFPVHALAFITKVSAIDGESTLNMGLSCFSEQEVSANKVSNRIAIVLTKYLILVVFIFGFRRQELSCFAVLARKYLFDHIAISNSSGAQT